MLTRDTAKAEIVITKSEIYPYSIIDNVDSVIDEIFDSIKYPTCDTCAFDYCGCSVQDSILQVEPDATFSAFGCINHELAPAIGVSE